MLRDASVQAACEYLICLARARMLNTAALYNSELVTARPCQFREQGLDLLANLLSIHKMDVGYRKVAATSSDSLHRPFGWTNEGVGYRWTRHMLLDTGINFGSFDFSVGPPVYPKISRVFTAGIADFTPPNDVNFYTWANDWFDPTVHKLSTEQLPLTPMFTHIPVLGVHIATSPSGNSAAQFGSSLLTQKGAGRAITDFVPGTAGAAATPNVMGVETVASGELKITISANDFITASSNTMSYMMRLNVADGRGWSAGLFLPTRTAPVHSFDPWLVRIPSLNGQGRTAVAPSVTMQYLPSTWARPEAPVQVYVTLITPQVLRAAGVLCDELYELFYGRGA